MTRTTLAVAADYADAMMVARRAKNWLFIILLLIFLGQLSLFFVVRYARNVDLSAQPVQSGPEARLSMDVGTLVTPATQVTTTHQKFTVQLAQWLINASDFLGVVLVAVLAVVLFLIAHIMLVGRLVGVRHLTAAFIWCVVLAVLLFPWQSFLTTYGDPSVPDFKIPGVLYTWSELSQFARFPNQPPLEALLKWSRFAGFPVLSIIILLSVQARSSRGLKLALGEAEVVAAAVAEPVVAPLE